MTMQKNHRRAIRFAALITAVFGMGLTMPSCPGQTALQQQVDTLQAANADLTKKVQTLLSQQSALTNDMTQVKQLLPQITNVIQAQKGALDQLEATVHQMHGGGKAKASKAPAKGKRH